MTAILAGNYQRLEASGRGAIDRGAATARDPVTYGVYGTFGWMALALSPGLAEVVLFSWVDRANFLSEAANIITDLAAIGIVGFAALRANWPVGDYLALSSLPRASTALIAVLGQIALFLIWAVARDFDLSSLARLATIDTSLLSNVELWLWLFSLTIVTPISEEIVFRGFMFRGLAQSRMQPVVAILITSIVFSLLHFDWSSLLGHYACGFFFGCLRWRSGSTWASIFAHVTINIIGCAFIIAKALSA
jgi:membrane protease YdiL (CAAX protease family)